VRSGSTVKEVAESLPLSAPEVIKKLMELGEMATLTQTLSDEAIEVLAEALEKKVTIHSATEDVEEEPAYEDADDELIERPPVITTTARRRCSTRSGRPRSRRARPAASRSTSAPTRCTTTATRSPSSTHRATRPSRPCEPAAPRSRTSP
jgi:hypothetical protein